SSSHKAIGRQERLMISLVCCRRDDAEPPNAKINAAVTAPPGCQPRSRKNSMSPMPPANRYMKVMKSTARKFGVGSNAARAKCSGEKINDCGSAICGQPANTFGVQNGCSPRASEDARNCNPGWNCALASHGIVTAPESHGHDRAANAAT